MLHNCCNLLLVSMTKMPAASVAPMRASPPGAACQLWVACLLRTQVAQAFSEDAARKGGDLGWKRRNEVGLGNALPCVKLTQAGVC